MINGAHLILYSSDAEADRAFLRDVLRLPHVDVGAGWLIFGLPPAEVAVHPAERSGEHQFFFMCENIEDLVRSIRAAGVSCSAISEHEWGRLVQITLPGGGEVGAYEPKHARPPTVK